MTYSSPFDIAKDVVHLRVLNTLRLEDASLVGEFKVGFLIKVGLPVSEPFSHFIPKKSYSIPKVPEYDIKSKILSLS